MLDHQPLVTFFAVFEFDEDEAAAELFAVEGELEFAAVELPGGVESALRLKGAAVPDHDGARAVAARGDAAFEIGVIERMIFDVDGEALVVGIERRALGDSPGFQGAVDGEAEIVVEAGSGMLLDNEGGLGFRGGFGTGGLGGAVELTLLVVVGEFGGSGHGAF